MVRVPQRNHAVRRRVASDANRRENPATGDGQRIDRLPLQVCHEHRVCSTSDTHHGQHSRGTESAVDLTGEPQLRLAHPGPVGGGAQVARGQQHIGVGHDHAGQFEPRVEPGLRLLAHGPSGMCSVATGLGTRLGHEQPERREKQTDEQRRSAGQLAGPDAQAFEGVVDQELLHDQIALMPTLTLPHPVRRGPPVVMAVLRNSRGGHVADLLGVPRDRGEVHHGLERRPIAEERQNDERRVEHEQQEQAHPDHHGMDDAEKRQQEQVRGDEPRQCRLAYKPGWILPPGLLPILAQPHQSQHHEHWHSRRRNGGEIPEIRIDSQGNLLVVSAYPTSGK